MPHSRRLTPEATDDNRDRDTRERNPSNASHTDNDDPSPPVASSRRDENSISFRHFLQPQSDVVPSRHRNSRGPNSGSVDLVDGVAMALPDFVQDHLVLDSAASSSTSTSGINSMGNGEQLLGATSLLHHTTGSLSLDLSASTSSSATNSHSHNHNDFAISSSQRTQSYLSKRNRRHQESSNSVSHSNGDVPNQSSASSSHSQQQGPVALPDFLSDGPMLCSTNNTNNHADVSAHLGSSNCSSPRRAGGSAGSSGHHSRSSNSSRDSSEPLSHQIERLRRELAEKNRRLSQLESDLARQRSESSMFETAYLNSEQGLQTATRRASAAEARVAELNNELQFFKNQLSERMTLKRSTGSGNSAGAGIVSSAQPSLPTLNSGSSSSASCRNGPTNPNVDSNRVMEIAFSAEFLVGELMEQLDALKLLAVASATVLQPAPKEKEADDESARMSPNVNVNPNTSTNFSSTSSKDKDKSKSKDGPKISK